MWALALVPLRDLVPASDEVWWEKAYLPGMAAIAWGVLAALLARRWRPAARDARALALFGLFCILLPLGWGDYTYKYLYKSGLYWLCLGASLFLVAMRGHPMPPRRGLGWLARAGALSYELYLSHMFVVLGTVGLYRALFGPVQTWTFAVYLPVVALSFCLGALIEKMQRFRTRR
jgi:peptidoglycan/LPS O-acetylase OafA/YrhL